MWLGCVAQAAMYPSVFGVSGTFEGVALRCASVIMYGVGSTGATGAMAQMEKLRVELWNFGLERDMAAYPFKNSREVCDGVDGRTNMFA